MNDVAGNYIRLIDTADSVDKISEITNRAAWDVSITNQEYCEIYDYAVNKVAAMTTSISATSLVSQRICLPFLDR